MSPLDSAAPASPPARIVALNLQAGEKKLSMFGEFQHGATPHDYYSGSNVEVGDGMIGIDSPHSTALLGVRE